MSNRHAKILMRCGMAGMLASSACATTQETVQQCRRNAYAYCDGITTGKDAKAGGTGTADPAARSAAYQQCLDAQLLACGAP